MNIVEWEDEDCRRAEYDAVVSDDRVWSNRELHDASCRLASALVDLGIAPAEPVLVLLPNCAELMYASSAIWRSGAVAALAFAGAAPPEVARIARHCGARAIVTVPAVLHRVGRALEGVAHKIVVGAQDGTLEGTRNLDEMVARSEPLAEPVPRAPEDPAQITYTSGTTGEPKAVLYTHAGTRAVLEWRRRDDIQSEDSIELVVLPPAAFSARVMRTRFASRHKLVLQREFEPAATLAAIERHRVTRIALVPSMCEALLASADLARRDVSSLREIMVAGAHVSTHLAERIQKAFGLPPAVHYGMAEIGGPLTWHDPPPKPGSVGRAATGAEIKVVDENGDALGPGVTGMLYARAPWMAAGYFNSPELTKAAFRDGWFDTGDLGFKDADGEIFLVGRSKDVIIQSGVNVYPAEVAEIIEQVPGVLECAVVGVPHSFLGEEVVACVVVRPGASVTGADIRAHCLARLDVRKVPLRIRFFESLPKSPVGKVLSSELRRTLLEQRGGVVETALVKRLREATHEERMSILSGVIERELVDVLHTQGVDDVPDGFERDATFGDLGLESHGAVRLANALCEALGRPVPSTLTFRHPTIDDVARMLLRQLFGRPRAEKQLAPSTGHGADRAIAIVGIGCRLPGGVNGPEDFWQLLRRETDCVREVPGQRWNMDDWFDPERWIAGKTYTKRANLFEDVSLFDAHFFKLAPEAEGLDPQHRLLLEVCWEALEDAGCRPEAVPGGAVGAFFGICGTSYESDNYLGRVPSMATARICQAFDLRGPAVTIDTTCSSSLVALHYAARSLNLRECEVALVGGVNVIGSPWTFVELAQLNVLAADGRCKAFDASADGFGRGEGCIVFVLKRLADALSHDDRIYAVVRGTAVNHDGRSSSLIAPNVRAQEEVVWSALEAAALAPDAIQYVETFGASTQLGDAIEIEALANVFGGRGAPSLAVGTVKSHIGHLEAAAGVAGVLKTVLALAHRELPATLHVKSLNANIPWDEIPIRVHTECGPWPDMAAPLVAGVSAFGMSGTNAHVVLEEPPRLAVKGASSSHPGAEVLALPISASSKEALVALARRYATLLQGDVGSSFADVVYTASCRRSHLRYRLVAIGRSAFECAGRFEAYADGRMVRGLWAGEADRCRLVMVFPGEAALWLGAARELYAAEPAFREAVEQTDAALVEQGEGSLLSLFRDDGSGPCDDASAAAALFASQLGLTACYRAWGIEPDAVTGAGVGELVAACVAGILTLEEAVSVGIARRRRIDEPRRERVALRPRPGKIRFLSIRSGEPRDVLDPAYWYSSCEGPVSRLEDLRKERTTMLELGPPAYTAGHADSQARDGLMLSALRPDQPALESLLESVSALHVAGHAIDWAKQSGGRGRVVTLPSYPWQHKRYWPSSR